MTPRGALQTLCVAGFLAGFALGVAVGLRRGREVPCSSSLHIEATGPATYTLTCGGDR